MAEENRTMSNREQIVDLLGRLHPEGDMNDDEVLFGLIIDDYEQYAALIQNREAELAQARSAGEIDGRNATIDQMLASAPHDDGVPALGGANNNEGQRERSIFDIAREG